MTIFLSYSKRPAPFEEKNKHTSCNTWCCVHMRLYKAVRTTLSAKIGTAYKIKKWESVLEPVETWKKNKLGFFLFTKTKYSNCAEGYTLVKIQIQLETFYTHGLYLFYNMDENMESTICINLNSWKQYMRLHLNNCISNERKKKEKLEVGESIFSTCNSETMNK